MFHHLGGWFSAGGPFMWAILGILAVASAIALERVLFYVIICRTQGIDVLKKVLPNIEQGKYQEARMVVSKRSSPLFRLLDTMLRRYDEKCSMQQLQDALDEAAIKEIPRMANRLNYIGLFANISTLMGLLGTVTGLQISFASLASVEAAKKATLLASGISQAMNCTAFGLIVAISCMIVYTMLYNKQATITKDIDQTIVRLINYVKQGRT